MNLKFLELSGWSNSPKERRLLAFDESLDARKSFLKRADHLGARHVSRGEKERPYSGSLERFQLHRAPPNSAVFRQQDPTVCSGFVEQNLVGHPLTEEVTTQVDGEPILAKRLRKLLSTNVLVQEERREIKRCFLAARRGWRP